MKLVERQTSRTDGTDPSQQDQPGVERKQRQRGVKDVERKPDREQIRKTILDKIGVETAALSPPGTDEERTPGRKLRWLPIAAALFGLLVASAGIWFYLYATSLNLGD